MDGRRASVRQHFRGAVWRSVKYEEVYLKDYRNVPEARQGWTIILRYYNDQRSRFKRWIIARRGSTFWAPQ